MAVVAFIDHPALLLPFSARWCIREGFTREAIGVCAKCGGELHVGMVTDTMLDDETSRVFFVIELMSRGWRVTSQARTCPGCR
jgi:hypothetical protein